MSATQNFDEDFIRLAQAVSLGDTDKIQTNLTQHPEYLKRRLPQPYLARAARSGDTKTIQTLLSCGADINEQGERGWTPLMYAAYYGQTQAVQFLLENNAYTNSETFSNKPGNGQTALDLVNERLNSNLSDAERRKYEAIRDALIAKGARANGRKSQKKRTSAGTQHEGYERSKAAASKPVKPADQKQSVAAQPEENDRQDPFHSALLTDKDLQEGGLSKENVRSLLNLTRSGK